MRRGATTSSGHCWARSRQRAPIQRQRVARLPREPRPRAATAHLAKVLSQRRGCQHPLPTSSGSKARHALTDGRERRKALCRAFSEKHAVAQVDPHDRAVPRVVAEARRPDAHFVFVAGEGLSSARPPTLYLREYGGKKDHRLTRLLHSPRGMWSACRGNGDRVRDDRRRPASPRARCLTTITPVIMRSPRVGKTPLRHGTRGRNTPAPGPGLRWPFFQCVWHLRLQ